LFTALLKYLIERAERMDTLNSRRSARQNAKIAMDADVQRFGSEQVFRGERSARASTYDRRGPAFQ